MRTHPRIEVHRFTGQVCVECSAAYAPGKRVCENPACFANPDLSDENRQTLAERAERARQERIARRKRQRHFARSLRRN